MSEKRDLAEECLALAQETLQDLRALRGEASVKDLIAIFQVSVRTHRDLTADLEKNKEEEVRVKRNLEDYGSKVQELLNKIK